MTKFNSSWKLVAALVWENYVSRFLAARALLSGAKFVLSHVIERIHDHSHQLFGIEREGAVSNSMA